MKIACLLLFFLTLVSPQSYPYLLGRPPQIESATTDTQKDEIARLLIRADATSDLKQKERLYLRILEIDPFFEEARRALGEVRREIELEERRAEEARDMERENRELRDAAESAYSNGDLEEAQDLVNQALTQQPDDPDLVRLRSWIENDIRSAEISFYLWLGFLIALLVGISVFLFFWIRKRKTVLEVLEGPEAGKIFVLNQDRTSIGALDSEVDFVVQDDQRKISRHHCDIVKDSRRFFLIDYSTNGSWLNGNPVPVGEAVLIKPGDRICLADEIVLRVRKKFA